MMKEEARLCASTLSLKYMEITLFSRLKKKTFCISLNKMVRGLRPLLYIREEQQEIKASIVEAVFAIILQHWRT